MNKKKEALWIEFVRIFFLVALYSVLIFKYFSHFEFVNTDGVFPVYFCLIFSFFIHGLYVFFIDHMIQRKFLNELVFYYEALIITFFAYFLRFSPAIYIFMYLVNLILAGSLKSRRRVVCLSLFTACLFHGLIFFLPPSSNSSLFFLLVINDFIFLITGFLSVFFREKKWVVRFFSEKA